MTFGLMMARAKDIQLVTGFEKVSREPATVAAAIKKAVALAEA